MAMICGTKDLFTCQASWQGSDKKTENAPSLIKLVHQPDKSAGVGPGTSARANFANHTTSLN